MHTDEASAPLTKNDELIKLIKLCHVGSQKMSQTINDIRIEHLHINLVLHVLKRELQKLNRFANADFHLLLAAMAYMHEFVDKVHHHKENIVLRLLANKRPEALALVLRLKNEHRYIANFTSRIALALEQCQKNPTRASFKKIAMLLQEYLDVNYSHMQLEETQAVTHLTQNLDANFWQEVQEKWQDQQDPLFGPEPKEQFATLRKAIVGTTSFTPLRTKNVLN